MPAVVVPSVLTPAERHLVARTETRSGRLQRVEPTQRPDTTALAIASQTVELGDGGSNLWLGVAQPAAAPGGEFVPSTRLRSKAAAGGRFQAHSKSTARSTVRAQPQAPRRTHASCRARPLWHGLRQGVRGGRLPDDGQFLEASSSSSSLANLPVHGRTGSNVERQCQQEQHGEQEVQQLINSHVPLVHWLAHKLRSYGLPHQDLVGEGLAALQAAAAGFQVERGTKFSTYAWTAISQRMKHATLCYSRPVRVPEEKWNLMQQERAVRRGLETTLGRTPTLSEVAAAMSAQPEQLAGLRRLQLGFQPAVGALRQFGEGSGGKEAPLTLADLVADEQQAEGDSGALALEATMSELLDYLPPQQRLAVQLRYGLADGKERKLQEVAEALQVSKNAASRLLTKALGTLRVLVGAELDGLRPGTLQV